MKIHGMNDIDNKINIILPVEARFVLQSASGGARRSDAQEVHVEVPCECTACRSAMRKTLAPALPADTRSPRPNVEKLAPWSKFTLPQTKRGGKDLEQRMFLILRMGSSVGFVVGDHDNKLALESYH